MNFQHMEEFYGVGQQALIFYGMEQEHTLNLLHCSENITFFVENQKLQQTAAILRISRPGYHTPEELKAEICWLNQIIKDTEVQVARPIANRGGQVLTRILWEGQIYYCMMSEFLTGEMPHPQAGKKSMAEFEQVGEIAATLHRQAMGWDEGKKLDRPIWDYETLLGESALFGDWRQCPDLDFNEFALLDRTCAMIREHFTAYGKDEHNFGLIHSDLRAANLLMEGDQMKVLDFDDCGYGWHLQDLAASISFLEEDPCAVEWMEAWIVGYQRILPFRKRERDEIATFVMARRIQLLAWITSHEDSDPVHNLYEGFAKGTCRMAEKYLLSFDHLKTTVSGGQNRTL